MIKLKESQLVAMLEVAKNNPNVDTWDLMSVAGVEPEQKNEFRVETHFTSLADLAHTGNEKGNSPREETIEVIDLIDFFRSFGEQQN